MSLAEGIPVGLGQTAATAYFSSKQLLLFVFAMPSLIWSDDR